jgi:hypothetical protein
MEKDFFSKLELEKEKLKREKIFFFKPRVRKGKTEIQKGKRFFSYLELENEKQKSQKGKDFFQTYR